MGAFAIEGFPSQGTVVVRLRQNLVEHAKRASKSDGADNVFVSLDGDTYAISAAVLPSERMAKGNSLVVNGKSASITHVDNQFNTALEGATFGYGAAAAGAVGGTVHVTRSVMAHAARGGGFFRNLGHGLKQTGLAGLAVAGLTLVTAAGGAAYALMRKNDPRYLDPFGDVVTTGE